MEASENQCLEAGQLGRQESLEAISENQDSPNITLARPTRFGLDGRTDVRRIFGPAVEESSEGQEAR